MTGHYFPIQKLEHAALSRVSEDWATNEQHGTLKEVQEVNKQRKKPCSCKSVLYRIIGFSEDRI